VMSIPSIEGLNQFSLPDGTAVPEGAGSPGSFWTQMLSVAAD